MKFKLQLILSILFTFFVSSATAALQNSIKIASGCYKPNKETQFPLIITSYDQGATWFYSPDISSRSNLPADFTEKENSTANRIFSISCHEKFCLGGGRYRNTQQKLLPLIALSQNNGTSWTYVPVKPKDYVNMVPGGLDPVKTSCNSKMCLVGMPYINVEVPSWSWAYFIAATENQGKSWVFAQLPELPKGRIIVKNFDCTDKTCVGVGYVKIEDESSGRLSDRGFIITSSDQAKTWSITKLYPTSSHFQDVKCKDNICIAMGYQAGDFILLRSRNGGLSWDSIQRHHLSASADYAYIGGGVITNTNKTWAVISTTHDITPFILVSQDDGITWSQSHKMLTKSRDPYHGTGELINCSDNDCIALAAGQITALSVSHDKGITWSPFTEISPPDMGRYGSLVTKIISDKNNFIILGEYSDQKDITKPYILVSHDQGTSWFWGAANTPYVSAEIFDGTRGF